MEPRASELYKNILAWAKKRGWKGRTRTKVSIDEIQRIFALQSHGGRRFDNPRAELARLLKVLADAGLLTPLHVTDREKIPLPAKVWLEPVDLPIPQPTLMPRW